MSIIALLSGYCFITTCILIFLLNERIKFKKWYKLLLINPDSPFRVKRFFFEMERTFQSLYPIMKDLTNKHGRPLTDYRFQFRWLIWWKFFGPHKPCTAVREFNSSPFLKKLLRAPTADYSRWKLKYFLKKLGEEKIEQLQSNLITKFETQRLLDWHQVVIDSFPVKSHLNTSKCLRAPKINNEDLKRFINQIDLTKALIYLQISLNKQKKVKTKLVALLVKELWDLPSWNRCHTILFSRKALGLGLKLPHHYKTSQSLRTVQKSISQANDPHKLEKLLLTATVTTLQSLRLKPKNWHPKRFEELNGCLHKPHRWRDKGISLARCSSKETYFFGRGGLIAVLPSLELPIKVDLTPKYKQSEKSILIFFEKLGERFEKRLKGTRFLGDSEFGLKSVRQLLSRKLRGQAIFPNYGTKKYPVEMTKADQTTRKMVERVIGRLTTTWGLENPPWLGTSFAKAHLQLCMLCDLLQVKFNLQMGNYAHPHAIKEIRG